MYSIESTKLNNLDILQEHLFQVYILDAPKVMGAPTDEIMLRCRNVSIPERTIEDIESFFMGQSQRFAGRTVFGKNMTITVEEFEDQLGIESFVKWMDGVERRRDGTASLQGKANYTSDIEIVMFKHGKIKSKYRILVKNCFVSQIPTQDKGHENNASVKHQIQFVTDAWELKRN